MLEVVFILRLSIEPEIGTDFELFKGIVLLKLDTIQTLSKFYPNSLPKKLEYCFPQLSARVQEDMSLLFLHKEIPETEIFLL